MRSFRCFGAVVLLFSIPASHGQVKPTPQIQFVSSEKGIKLEVLDWGGAGQPLVLLPGLGDTAHVFDTFAPRLASTYHVLGITPRGFGASTAVPAEPENYSADRLGDDVVAVIDALHLYRPVLAGHSIAGEVLSAVGTRHPEKVSALVYIDAGYPYALYDQAHGDLVLDCMGLRNTLNQIHIGTLPRDVTQVDELLRAVRRLQEELQQRHDDLAQDSLPRPIDNPISVALLEGQQKFASLNLPVLAIFNVPHSSAFRRTMENQAKAFEDQVPHARIVRIENADHYLFQSKADDVLREINAFTGNLHRK